jgi:hypothetical protein
MLEYGRIHDLGGLFRFGAAVQTGGTGYTFDADGGGPAVRIAVRDDVRELSPGDHTVFESSRNPATTGPSARD